MMLAKIIKGNCYQDDRGSLFYNNDFDATVIKRVYIIENKNTATLRAWMGHKIEERWFSAITGSFEIQLIAIDNWKQPSKDLEKLRFELTAASLDVLHIPGGYVCSIKSLEEGSKLLGMANYGLGELVDEYRFEPDYFG